jgi:hypothetical protein
MAGRLNGKVAFVMGAGGVDDESKYVTGICLPVDGGKSCWGR